MRIWPFSPSLDQEISYGVFHWISDQFANIHMALLIRRSRRIDDFVLRAKATRPSDGAGNQVPRRIESRRSDPS